MMNRKHRAPRQPAWLTDIDWEKVASLRLHSSATATSVLTGLHRSPHAGDGIEFGGHRPYVPGDDLRWLDRHAMLRHDKLIVRRFHTERSRSVLLIVDATASMGYRSERSKYSKFEYGALLAATLLKIALRHGDRVGLAWLGGTLPLPVAPSSSKVSFDRAVIALASQQPAGDAVSQPRTIDDAIARAAKFRSDITILLSDLLDVPGPPSSRLSWFSGRGRDLRVVQVLDPQEQEFSFRGSVRLRSLEGRAEVEAVGQKARPAYLQRLRHLQRQWREGTLFVGGRFTTCSTDENAVEVVRRLIVHLGRGREVL